MLPVHGKPNGKRQIQVEKFSIESRKWADKLTKTILMEKIFCETTNLCEEIMNSKWRVKGKLGHVVQIRVCRLT